MGMSIAFRICIAVSSLGYRYEYHFRFWVGVIPLGFGYMQHIYDMNMSITIRIWIGVLPLEYR